ncbi:undecaprenyl-diphosphate phosphatase [Candidatus Thorarchaeota archaeon]|nr:MAG: undecaprenyl-diphosphate phosphatase [Candidatus Thorarchaeota archaeon]
MELWQIIVALLQGLIEWLPISSEGQVVFFIYNFTTVPTEQIMSLVIWLHLGTALAVIVRYPKTIIEIISLKDRKLLKLLILATTGTAITAIPLYFFLKTSISVFQGELLNILVGILLLVTAFMLYIPTRRKDEVVHNEEMKEVSEREAILTGLVQGTSVLPGLSRSGVTISSLLMQKIDKETALRFSFLMSVPAVLGILILEILTGAQIPASVSIVDLVIIELIVFVVGLGSMEFLLRLARKVSFWKLCLILALVAILFGLPAFI